MRIVGSIASVSLAGMIALGNVLGRQYNKLIEADGNLAAIIAGAVVAALLLCCVCVFTCYRCSRPRGS